jgi:hypothetical protein
MASMAPCAVLCLAVLCLLTQSTCVMAQPASSPSGAFGTLDVPHSGSMLTTLFMVK